MSEKKPLEQLFIRRGSSFEFDFASYRQDKEFEAYRKAIGERRYTANQIGLEYRVASHWDDMGILPDCSRDEGEGWRKFSFVEAVWIFVAMRLRKFGTPLPVIKEIRGCVLEWVKEDAGYPMFEYYLLKAVENDADQYVIYLPTSNAAGLVSGRELELLKSISEPEDMLLISLKSVIGSIGFKTAPAAHSMILSDAEMEMVMEYRTMHNGKLTVEKKENSTEVESSRTYPDLSTLRDITNALKNDKGFGDVTIHFRDGKGQTVKSTKRTRFK